MNARIAIQENEIIINQIIERAERVASKKSITTKEALEFGREIEMKHATNDTAKAAIDLRYDEAIKKTSSDSINWEDVKEVLDNASWTSEYNWSKGSDDEKAEEWLTTQKFSVEKIKEFKEFAQGKTAKEIAESLADVLAFDRIPKKFNWNIGESTSFQIY